MASELIGLAQQIEALAKRRDPTALAEPPAGDAAHDPRPAGELPRRRRPRASPEHGISGRRRHDALARLGRLRSKRSQLTLQVPDSRRLDRQGAAARRPQRPVAAGPVAGTLTRPQMDQRAIASLSQQLLQSAAGQADRRRAQQSARQNFQAAVNDPTNRSRCHDSSRFRICGARCLRSSSDRRLRGCSSSRRPAESVARWS